jgi:hypothetical protein
MRQRRMLTGVGAAQQRLRTAQATLADARANPKALHDLSRLENDVLEAKRLVAVAYERAQADMRIAAEKAALDVLG